MKYYKLLLCLAFLIFSFHSNGHEIDSLLKIEPKITVVNEKIELWDNIVNLSLWQKSEQDTKKYIDNLKQYATDKKSKYGLATADLLYAKYFERLQEMEKAIKHADAAYSYFSETQNKLGMCKALRQKGFNSFKISNIEQATEFGYKALALSVELKNKVQEGICLSQVGMFVFGIQPSEGIKLAKQGFDLLIKTDAKREASITAVTLSTLYLNSDDIEKSLHYIDTVFVLQKQYNDIGLLAEAKPNAAIIAVSLGDYKKAEQLIEESGVYFLQLNSEVVKAKYLRIKSIFYRESNRFPEAIVTAKEALSLIENKQGLDNEKGMLQYTLFVSYKELKQYELAIEAYEQAVNHEFALYDEQSQLGIADLKEKYETEKKEQENKELKQINEINNLKINSNRNLLIGIVLLSVLSILVIVLIMRNNKVKARAKNLTLQQRLLVSQMNPHFIFNSLNSIQNFIYKQDALTASTYLSRFSELMRMILNYSRKDQITLAEEKQLLERYLDIQKLRFGEKLIWKITSDSDIDDENVLIQPMLAQPFIENALEHGLFKNDSQGEITIHFKKEADLLIFTIEDNGVGIQPSQTQNSNHESLATVITLERIVAIKTLSKKSTTFELINLQDVNPTLHGVKVVFRIPYQTAL